MEVEFSQVAFLKVFLLPTGTDHLVRSPEPQFCMWPGIQASWDLENPNTET